MSLDTLSNYRQALETEANFYVRLYCGSDQLCTGSIDKYALFQRLTRGARIIVRTDNPSDLLQYDNPFIQTGDNSNQFRPAFGLTIGDQVFDIFGALQYELKNGQYVPVAGSGTRQSPMISDNLLHENMGHWFMYASGMGSRYRSPLAFLFPEQEETQAILIEIIEGFEKAVYLDFEDIGPGTRQSVSLDPNELRADLAMFIASGLTTEYDPTFAAALRQALLFGTSPKEYYAELADEIGGKWDESAPIQTEVQRDTQALMFTTEADTIGLATEKQGVYEEIPDGQGGTQVIWHDAIVLNTAIAGLPVTSDVTIIGRTEQPMRDYLRLEETDAAGNPRYQVNQRQMYWFYVGWQAPEGGFQYGWVREDKLNTQPNLEKIPEISFDDVNALREFSREDEFNPPDDDFVVRSSA